MNFLFTQQILLFLVGTVGSGVAILGLFFNQWITNKKHLRRFLGIICTIIAGAYAANCAYLEIVNIHQIHADLYITIALPYLVNVGGTHNDPFIQNADYSVIAYNRILSLDTTIELLNVKTYEKFIYNPSFADFGADLSYRLANVSSGEYDIKISADDYPLYEERFGIFSENTESYEMFKAKVDWNDNGHMAGKFYGYKDVYFIGNAMTDTRMETVIVDVT